MKNWIFPQVVTKIIIQSSSWLFQLQEVEGGEGWKCGWKTHPCRGYEREQIQLNYYDRQQLLFVCWLKLTVHSRPWKQQLTKQSQLKVHLLTVMEVKVPWAEIVLSPAVSWIRNELSNSTLWWSAKSVTGVKCDFKMESTFYWAAIWPKQHVQWKRYKIKKINKTL